MKYEPFLFDRSRLGEIGEWMGASLAERKGAAIYALTVQSWHCHVVIGPTNHDIADVVKCAKDAVRYGMRVGRPIWTDGYDKRFCFDETALRMRIEYVERHNLDSGWAARPWGFLRSRFGRIWHGGVDGDIEVGRSLTTAAQS
jgi:hypothetical protein